MTNLFGDTLPHLRENRLQRAATPRLAPLSTTVDHIKAIYCWARAGELRDDCQHSIRQAPITAQLR